MPKSRIVWLDFVRSFAIFSVVVVHCTERIYNMDFEGLQSLSTASGLFRDALCFFGRLGVPVFIMLSGYLLLQRDYSDSKKIAAFYKHNLVPLLVTSEVWIVIYAIRHFVKGDEDYAFLDLIKEMLFLNSNAMSHMWYIPMIIGIYFIIPFLANAVRNIGGRVMWVPVCIAFAAVYVLPFLSALGEVFGWEYLPKTYIDKTFIGGTYGIYLIMGLMLRRGAFRKIKAPVLMLAIAASFGLCVWILFGLRTEYDYSFRLWYDSPFILIASVSVVELIGRIDFESKSLKRLAPAAACLSSISFGVYFIHKPLSEDLGFIPDSMNISEPYKAVIYTALIFALSCLIAFAVSKIPVAKKILLNIKSK